MELIFNALCFSVECIQYSFHYLPHEMELWLLEYLSRLGECVMFTMFVSLVRYSMLANHNMCAICMCLYWREENYNIYICNGTHSIGDSLCDNYIYIYDMCINKQLEVLVHATAGDRLCVNILSRQVFVVCIQQIIQKIAIVFYVVWACALGLASRVH